MKPFELWPSYFPNSPLHPAVGAANMQISADHTPDDIDTALDALGHFVG
jgi:hypothetical protein